MDHVELFQALAARSPDTAASYIAEMWCQPVISLYAIDISQLRLEQRDEVIETRVMHKQELTHMYWWLWQQADFGNDDSYNESLEKIELELAKFAMTDADAKSFVLDVTGWSASELASIYENATIDWHP